MGNCVGVMALGGGLLLPAPENVGAFGRSSIDGAVPLWRWGDGEMGQMGSSCHFGLRSPPPCIEQQSLCLAVGACVWRSEVSLQCYSSETIHLIFF